MSGKKSLSVYLSRKLHAADGRSSSDSLRPIRPSRLPSRADGHLLSESVPTGVSPAEGAPVLKWELRRSGAPEE